MKRLFLIAVLAASFLPGSANASEAQISRILRNTNALMREKKYDEAAQGILAKLKTNRNSYKLWLALGYVLEADEQNEKALKAFYNARNLKMGIEGLRERIIRLEALLALKKEDNSVVENESGILEQAKQSIARKNIKKGLELFSEAVLKDRKLLATENTLLSLGLAYFSNEKNSIVDEERHYYLGLFSFFNGDYDAAGTELEKLVMRFPDSRMLETAQGKIAEINLIKKQMREASVIAPAKNIPPEKTAQNVATADKPATTPVKEPEKTAYIPPVVQDEYAAFSSDELYSEAINLANTRPTKAIGLISRAISKGSDNSAHYQTLADLYASRKGFKKEAIATYRKIIEKFPGTDAEKDARQRILSMNPSANKRSQEVTDYYLKK